MTQRNHYLSTADLPLCAEWDPLTKTQTISVSGTDNKVELHLDPVKSLVRIRRDKDSPVIALVPVGYGLSGKIAAWLLQGMVLLDQLKKTTGCKTYNIKVELFDEGVGG